MDQPGEAYGLGAFITGMVIFLRTYKVFFKKYGGLGGTLLGLVPALMAAILSAVIWPVVAIVYFVRRA